MFGIVMIVTVTSALELIAANKRNTFFGLSVFVAAACYLLPMLWNRAFIRGLGEFIRNRSPRRRDALRTEIEEWKERERAQAHN